MKEFQFYIDLIKELVDTNKLKGTLYYNEGEWYSREHSSAITLGEIKEMVLEIASQKWRSEELNQRMESFISEKYGGETLDRFWSENQDL